jgi:hypothetical protein
METTNRRSPRNESSLPDLIKLRRQLDSWRKAQPGRARLPADVWEQAAMLARTLGVSQVSRTLRLSFHKLQRRVRLPTPRPSGPPASAEFIELPSPAGLDLGGGGCVVELCDGGQAMMTVRCVASVSVRKGKKPGRLCEGLDFGGSVTGGVQPVEGEVIVWL